LKPIELAAFRERKEQAMADPNNSVGDEVVTNKNGTIRIGLAGHFYTWRRPTIGEFRKFNEQWAEVATQERVIVDTANAIAVKDRLATWRFDYEAKLADLFAEWALSVFRVLCDKEPPAVDDLPPWMATAQFRMDLVEHWTTVPLAASSSRP
jgi:hypothetical protein